MQNDFYRSKISWEIYLSLCICAWRHVDFSLHWITHHAPNNGRLFPLQSCCDWVNTDVVINKGAIKASFGMPAQAQQLISLSLGPVFDRPQTELCLT